MHSSTELAVSAPEIGYHTQNWCKGKWKSGHTQRQNKSIYTIYHLDYEFHASLVHAQYTLHCLSVWPNFCVYFQNSFEIFLFKFKELFNNLHMSQLDEYAKIENIWIKNGSKF